MMKMFCDACRQEIHTVISQLPLLAAAPGGGVPFQLTCMPENPNQQVCIECVITALKSQTV